MITDLLILAIVAPLIAAGVVSMYKGITYREALMRVIKYPFTFFKTTPKP